MVLLPSTEKCFCLQNVCDGYNEGRKSYISVLLKANVRERKCLVKEIKRERWGKVKLLRENTKFLGERNSFARE